MGREAPTRTALSMSLLGTAGATVTGLDSDVERVLDLAGILAFAISGGLTAVRKEFDVVGVVALCLVTALGGGILRDLLLGDTPPVALARHELPRGAARGGRARVAVPSAPSSGICAARQCCSTPRVSVCSP